MRFQDKLVLAMTTVMLVLAVPCVLLKTGVWAPAESYASDSPNDLPTRDPDELSVIGQISDFSMTNQLGQTVRRDDLLGQVWVADVIFTRCPGPCSRMTTRMADLQASIPKDWPVKFVSLTTDADYDTPEVLHRYAEGFQADSSRWNFLHSTKSSIANLAVNNLKLVVLDKEQDRQSLNDLFIHSTTLALVDKHGRLRGAFESVPMVLSEDDLFTKVPTSHVDRWESTLKPRLLKAIEQLVEED